MLWWNAIKKYVFEGRIQRLRDGLNFVEKGLGVHMQRMLKMSKAYTLAEILSTIFVKKEGKFATLFSIMVWQINDSVPTKFLLKYIIRSLFARRTPLHSENVD